MKKTVIAVSRSYASGGGEVAKKLANDLGVALFDKKILELAAAKSGLSADYIDGIEKHSTSSFLFSLAAAAYPASMFTQYDVPVTYAAFSAQSDAIREIARKDSCVILGRCAEYVLKDDPNCIKIFIYANREDRIKRVMEDLMCDSKAADDKITKHDKSRSNYYRDYTGEKWGNMYSHDLCINTSLFGIDGSIEVIKSALKALGRI